MDTSELNRVLGYRRFLMKDAEFESKHPREGGRFAPKDGAGEAPEVKTTDVRPPKILKNVPAKIESAVRDVIGRMPESFVSGIKVSYDKDANRSVYHLGEISLGSDVSPNIISSDDMDGERLKTADPGEKKGSINQMEQLLVENVGAHLAAQTISHEIGHHVFTRVMSEEEQKDAHDLFKKHGKNFETRATTQYKLYFEDAAEEGRLVPAKGVIDAKIRREQFAEVFRLKATENPRYDKLPGPIKKYFDDLFKK
jgi:hypothetical protein